MPILHNRFQEIETKGTLPNSFCGTSIVLIPNQTETLHSSCEQRDAKILNKILVNHIQQCIKRVIYHKPLGFIPDKQDWLTIQKSIN